MHGGLQSSTHNLCRKLHEKGHHVAVLAGLMPGGLFGFTAKLKMLLNRLMTGCKIARYAGLGYPVWFSWEPWDAISYVAAPRATRCHRCPCL